MGLVEKDAVRDVNKIAAAKFLAALGAGDVDTLKMLLTEDLVAITAGQSKVSATRDYQTILAIAGAFPVITKSGINFKILHLTAEDDRVACEAVGKSVMSNGQDYNNQYHFLFFFRDGKIFKLMEYLDNQLADEVLGPYLPA